MNEQNLAATAPSIADQTKDPRTEQDLVDKALEKLEKHEVDVHMTPKEHRCYQILWHDLSEEDDDDEDEDLFGELENEEEEDD